MIMMFVFWCSCGWWSYIGATAKFCERRNFLSSELSKRWVPSCLTSAVILAAQPYENFALSHKGNDGNSIKFSVSFEAYHLIVNLFNTSNAGDLDP